MKKFLLSLFLLHLVALPAFAIDHLQGYFVRPVSCPLRFSSMSQLKDQMQTLVSSLGNGCTQSGQQAIGSLNSSMANLENISNSYSNLTSTDNVKSNAQMARNLNQVLGSLNIIMSNNSCFYDIRSRGALPVLGDVIMSISQLGLLVPSSTGMLVASGGYVVGSGLKIINELVKKKFNFNKPEDRKAFIQLNCAFYDNRKIMEEAGIFNPETDAYQEELISSLKKERADLTMMNKGHEKKILEIEADLHEEIASLTRARENNLTPALTKQLDELAATMGSKPVDYADKWRQVTALSLAAKELLERLKIMRLEDPKTRPMLAILRSNLETILPDLEPKARAWTCSIDEYELSYRGPIIAFMVNISNATKAALSKIEAEASINEEASAKIISKKRSTLRETRNQNWTVSQRLISLEAKINSLELSKDRPLFSNLDEGRSDAVEILDYYRTLQNSILGREGRGYLKHSLENTSNLQFALAQNIDLYDSAVTEFERCSAAEKLRFSWAQYRYKVQESHDFISTNLDLYRSKYQVGKEKLKKHTRSVLEQVASVDGLERGMKPKEETVGAYMLHVSESVEPVELRLRNSKCF